MTIKPTMKNDIMFKYFFSKKGNEKYLECFLSSLLEQKIKIRKIIHDSHLEQKNHEDKYGILDLDVELENGEIINIEMQRKNLFNIEKRTSFHGAKKLTEQLKPGNKYENLKKVIIIAILDYSFIDLPEYINRTERVIKGHPEYKLNKIDATIKDMSNEYKLNNEVEYIYIELDKYRKSNPDMEKEINQWLAFLDMERGDLLKMAKNNKVVKEAIEEYEEMTDEELNKKIAEIKLFNDLEHGDALAFERRIGEEHGRKIGEELGKKIGKELGEKSANIKTAKYLLSINMPIKQIEKATGLSRNEIEKLK